jgi:hypothetical protein
VNKALSKTPQLVPIPYIRLGFKREDVQGLSNIFAKYEKFQPEKCEPLDEPFSLSNTQEQDFKQVGTVFGNVPVYYFNNPSDMLASQYSSKFANFQTEQGSILYQKAFNQAVPTLEDYKKSSPTLIIKDPFGRFLVLGEYEYKMAGGCGN